MGISTVERRRFKRRTFHVPNLLQKLYISFSLASIVDHCTS